MYKKEDFFPNRGPEGVAKTAIVSIVSQERMLIVIKSVRGVREGELVLEIVGTLSKGRI